MHHVDTTDINSDRVLLNIANDILGLEIMSYSGRFMYGKKCLAIVSKASEKNFIYDMGSALLTDGYFDDFPLNERVDLYMDLIHHMRSDNMGKDYVYYWPNISDQILEDEGISVDEY